MGMLSVEERVESGIIHTCQSPFLIPHKAADFGSILFRFQMFFVFGLVDDELQPSSCRIVPGVVAPAHRRDSHLGTTLEISSV